MGNKSGIKWNGVTQVQTQNTIETIGSDVQIILRDPRTEQEWVTSSTDYINALVSLGVISSSGGWGLTGNAGTDYTTNFIGTTDAQPFVAKSNNILMLGLSGATNQISLKTSEDPDNYAEYFGGGSDIDIRTFAAGVVTGNIYLNEDVNIYNNKLVVKADGNVGIGTAAPTSLLTLDDGDIEVIGNTNGLILESPDATRYRVTVANGGTLTVTAI
jgi:hypothetical protein